jgi:hypothetical protein
MPRRLPIRREGLCDFDWEVGKYLNAVCFTVHLPSGILKASGKNKGAS